MAKFDTIKHELAQHTQEIKIDYENYPIIWEQIMKPELNEYYENKTHKHFYHCSVEEELKQVS